jgi:hypothetical protein
MLLTSGSVSASPTSVRPIPGSHPAAELRATAKLLQDAGIPFIPVFGHNATTYKAAKKTWVKWKIYQTRMPTPQEIDNWLNDKRTGGLAVVNGGLSGILCVDTDTDAAESDYRAAFFDLLGGCTEYTPGGCHRFYRTAEGVTVPRVIKVQDFGELRGEGGYTVIAPTYWQDKHWRAVQGDLLNLHILTEAELERLIAFYRQRIRFVTPKQGEKYALSSLEARSSTPHHIAIPYNNKILKRTDIAYEDVSSEIEYRLGVTEYDANGYSNPVYCPVHNDKHRSASWNRDYKALKCQAGCTTHGFKPGWVSEIDTAAALGLIVNTADTSPLHLTTIKAILKRWKGREGDTLVKFLLAMRLNGYPDGAIFSEPEAIKACGKILGRKGVHAAIQRLIEFCPFASGYPTSTPQKSTLGTKKDGEGDEYCSRASGSPRRESSSPPNISRDTSSLENQNRGRGRPAIRYRMPSEAMLAAGLEIEIKGRLSLTLEELQTRPLMDLLLEQHVTRRPNKYAYRELGKEFGKGASTMRRHAANNPVIERTPTFSKEVEIESAADMAKLTNDSRGARGGRYVQNEWGRKFAATAENVEQALARGQQLTFYEIGVNHFSIKQLEAEQAERQREAMKLKERALRKLGELARAKLLSRERADVRAELREWAKNGDLVKLETFIAEAKMALRTAKVAAKIVPDSDPLLALAVELGAVVRRLEVEAEPPPVLYVCPNCGQTYPAVFGTPPDICPVCNDMTTWRLLTPPAQGESCHQNSNQLQTFRSDAAPSA